MAGQRKIIRKFIENRNLIVSNKIYNVDRTTRYIIFNTFFKLYHSFMLYLLIGKPKSSLAITIIDMMELPLICVLLRLINHFLFIK